jgi:zinc/manganese transport system substrate-binding protein
MRVRPRRNVGALAAGTGIAAALVAVLTLTACGDSAADDGEAKVVATTTVVADLAGNVAGDRAEIVGLLAPNSDPHDYEPRPSDAEAVAEADLVLKSGGDLDLWADEVIDAAGADPTVIDLIDSVTTIEGDHEHGEEGDGHEAEEAEGEEHEDEDVDPHWWQDPRNAIAAVREIQRALAEADPGGAETYQRNADRYIARVEHLDRQVADCMGALPAGERELVTTHGALGYFAERYGLEVIGAPLPALTTQAQPSAGETAALVDRIEDEGVNAIFPEAGLDPALEEALADEAGVEVGGALWADALGPEGSSGATYLEAMAANAETLARDLSGGSNECEIDLGG